MKEGKYEIHELYQQIKGLRNEMEKLKNSVSTPVPVGAIQAFAMEEAPDDWLVCDGTEYIIDEDKQELFDVIGDTFGGDGVKTFCVPDLRGQFVRGWDSDGNIDPERELGSYQDDVLQGHGHSIDSAKIRIKVSGEHSHTAKASKISVHDTTMFSSDVSVLRWLSSYGSDSGETTTSGSHSHNVEIESSFVGNAITSKYGKIKYDIETRPKNIALLYCIKF